MDNNNDIVEINSDTEDTLYDNNKIVTSVETENNEEIVAKPKKNRKLSKKGIIIIVCLILLILIIAGVLIYLFVFKKDKKEEPKKEEEKIVIQEKNYTYEDGVLKIKNTTGSIIGEYECTIKDAEKCYVSYLTNEDDNDMPIYQNQDNEILKQRSSVYYEQYVFINDDDKIILYDLKNNKSEGEYELVKTIDSKLSYVIVKNTDGKYGVLDFEDNKINTMLDFKYENLSMQDFENIFVYYNGKASYLINDEGEKLTNQLKGIIKRFNTLYVSLYSGNAYSLYDYDGTKLLSNLDYISFYEGYIITVKNKQILLYDQDLNKINEEGIALNVSNYSTIYTFDKNNNFVSTTKPFEVDAGDGFIRITSENGLVDKSFNTYEPIINKKYNYINYLDGKLYIYSNKEKTTKVGVYVCKNKNTVTSTDDTYKNCFIAKNSSIINEYEEELYTPIFDNKYILINDTADAESPKINIYDISNNANATSTPTNYKRVEVPVSNKEISIISTKNNQVICENSTGYLGIITLDGNGLTSILRFNDSNNGGNTISISKLNDKYYVVKRDKNYLYSINGGDPITSSQYEIIDYIYNKLVVKNTYYIIYSGGQILSNDFVYVNLNESYFVGIDKNNKLNIYEYTSSNGLIDESLTVKLSNYKDSYAIETEKNEFNVTSSYIIKIYNEDKTFTEYKYNTDWSLITNE